MAKKINPGIFLVLFFAVILGVGGYLTYQSLPKPQPGADGRPAGTPTGPQPVQPPDPEVEELSGLVAEQREADEELLREKVQEGVRHYQAQEYAAAVEAFKAVIAVTGWDEYTQVSFFNLGNIYADLHEYANAVFCYRQALRTGEQPDIYYNLALAEYRRGQLDAAEEALVAAWDLAPERAQNHSLLGQIRAAQGRFGEAIASTRNALELEPESYRLNYNLGQLLSTTQQYAEAIAAFQDALRLVSRPEDKQQARRRLAETYLRNDQPGPAVVIYRQLLEALPGDADALYNLGISLSRAKRWSEAEAALQRVVAARPGHADALFALATALTKTGQRAAAIDIYKQGLERDATNLEMYYRLGRVLVDANDDEAARKTFEQIIEIDPDSVQALNAHVHLGLLHDRNRRPSEAIRHLQQALALAPQEAYIYYNLGVVQQRLGALAEARSAYLSARTIDADNWRYARAVADVLYREKDYPGALSAYEYLLQVSPGNVHAYFMLGYISQQRQEGARAREMYQAVLRYNPPTDLAYNTHINLARLDDEAGDDDAALDELRTAIRLQTYRYEAYYNAGLVYRHQGDNVRAVANFKVALERAPNVAEVYQGLGYCYYDKGLFEEAEAAFAHAVELDPSNLEAQYNLKALRERTTGL